MTVVNKMAARCCRVFVLVSTLFFAGTPFALAIDHGYEDYGKLLSRHVTWDAKGVASSVDYAGFARDKSALNAVTESMSAVTMAQYRQFTRDQKLAFLINAYNAFTIQLILTRYPDLESIRDLGGFLWGSPWKKEFFSLLGEKRHLDWIEHDMIRAPGVFNEPRIHFVVNCASIGCPALRPEPMQAMKLQAQLEDSTRRFFRDRTRNRFDESAGVARVTRLLDWYGDDFEPKKSFLARYAADLADSSAAQDKLRAGDFSISFLTYDWKLNKQ